MRRILVLFLVVLLLSCSKKNKSKDPHTLIKGDWIGVLDPERSIYGQKSIFCIEDSVLAFGPYSEFVPYTLRNDSLLTKTDFDFRIVSLTADSLILTTNRNSLEDTFSLSRVVRKNNLVPIRILYGSSGCFGSCPSMSLEIDSARNFIFRGGPFTNKKGMYRGQLSQIQYERIIKAVRQLPDSLDSKYEAGWTDDQTAGVIIFTADRKIESAAYGFDKEPFELRLLFHKLSELYKSLELTPDTTLSPDYFYEYDLLKLPPLIPPLRIENRP